MKIAIDSFFTTYRNGTCNGIALWVDWLIDNANHCKSIVTTGAIQPIINGEFVQWDMFHRQGVLLIGKAQQVEAEKQKVQWNVTFKPKEGLLNFGFQIE